MRTYVTSTLPHVLVLLVLLWGGSIEAGILAGLGFGIGRSLVHPLRRSDPEGWDGQLHASRRLIGIVLARGVGFSMFAPLAM